MLWQGFKHKFICTSLTDFKDSAMKGDFTRDTFDPAKHFSRVLLQQGKVQLDADTNEQTAILLHYIRTLAADLIGPFAGPGPDRNNLGFTISVLPGKVFDPSNPDFSISKGRYYVDGILCENDENNLTYRTQNRYPNPPLPTLAEGENYLVYLDVWERHISYIDDDTIREKALGGPDTASRAEVLSQVKLQGPVDGITFPDENNFNLNEWTKLVELWQSSSSGCLKAKVKPSDIPNSPCVEAPDVKYRGLENQLYRVEIHNPGTAGAGATFKWSRDNGSVVTRIVDGTFAGTSCTVECSKGFESGNLIWVEFSNDEQELRGEPGTLVKVTKLENKVLTLDSSPSPQTSVPGEKWPTKVRRWDQIHTNSLSLAPDGTIITPDGTVKITENNDPNLGWIVLEGGLQIQFQSTAIKYRTGDYWLIPARVAMGDIEWPVRLDNGKVFHYPDGTVDPIPKPPFGVRHHYAPLALLRNQNGWNFIPLQTQFPPIQKNNGQQNLVSYGEAGIGQEPYCPPHATVDHHLQADKIKKARKL
jgi:hypothetical protein